VLRRILRLGSHEAQMSQTQFSRYKAFTFVYVMVWGLLVALLWAYWSNLNPYLRWSLAVIEALFVPDLRSLRVLIETHEKFQFRMSNLGNQRK
jgi:hypothetical protein